MLLATSSKANQLLLLTYVGHVRLRDMVAALNNVHAILTEMSPGLSILADYTHLDKMDADCLPEMGRMMEAVDKVGVGMVVRVIPHPDRDPGINILTRFHYRHLPKIVTCDNLPDGLRALSL